METNNVELSGNLGAKPELRYTPSNMAVCEVSLCVNESRKNKQGGWDKYPMWFRVTLFGDTAQAFANEMDKGSKVMVMGKLSASTWTDKNGLNREKIAIIANKFFPVARREDPVKHDAQFSRPITTQEDDAYL